MENDSEHEDLPKVFDLDEMAEAIHAIFREVQAMYNDANEEIFKLSGSRFEDKQNDRPSDEDSLYAIFKKIRRKLIQINKLLKNYIDNYVVTQKVSTGFIKFRAEQHGDKGDEDDFSLTMILDYLNGHSSDRDIQKHEQDLFVMCGLMNSFLLDKQFTLKEDRVASGYYEGTEGESLENTSKISIGLTNFIGNFGKILNQRVVKDKSNSEIKRVMDTEPISHNDTDYQLYKMPFIKNGQVLTTTEEDNAGVVVQGHSQVVRTEQHIHLQSGSHSDGHSMDSAEDLKAKKNSPINDSLDKELQELGQMQKNQAATQNESHSSSDEHEVKLVDDESPDASSNSNSSDNQETVDEMETQSEIIKDHDQDLEKDKQHFDDLEKDRLEHENLSNRSNEASQPSDMASSKSGHEAVPIDAEPIVDKKVEDQTNENLDIMSQDVSEQDIDSSVVVSEQTGDDHSEHSSPKDLISERTPGKSTKIETGSNGSGNEIQSNVSGTETDSKASGVDSMMGDMSQVDSSIESENPDLLSEEQDSTSQGASLKTEDLVDEGSQTSQKDEDGASPKNLRSLRMFGDVEEANRINPSQKMGGRMKMKKIQRQATRLSKARKSRPERKLNLHTFLNKKSQRFHKRGSGQIFRHKTFLPKSKLATQKMQKENSEFHPIHFGYSDKGYINPTIIKSNNSPTFEHKFWEKKSMRSSGRSPKKSFQVYGKKQWYQPKLKAYSSEESPIDLYSRSPLINLI